MPNSIFSQVDFILVRPQSPGNAGGAARALKNTNFEKMILVRPQFSMQDEDLIKFAMGGRSLIENAPVFEDLKEALKPYKTVLGTSRRDGGYRKNWISLFDLSPSIENLPHSGRIAILFGNETNGLANDEIESCHQILHIPSGGAYPISGEDSENSGEDVSS